MIVSTGRQFGYMFDETSLEFSFQYLFFIVQEGLGAFLDQ